MTRGDGLGEFTETKGSLSLAYSYRVQSRRRASSSARDEAWLEELYRLHAGTLRNYLLYRCPDAQLVDDIVSEAYLAAWRSRTSVPADARSWLLGTGRRVLATQQRTAARYQGLLQRVAVEMSTSREDQELSPEELSLRGMLAQLPEQDQEVLILAGWCEMSNTEAAKVLGCTAIAYGVRLHRARTRLRTLIKEEEVRHDGSP